MTAAGDSDASTSLKIVVGVAGGIAAYKACHLIRAFTEQGHQVRVVPTEAALKFVGAATFEALSGNPVATSVFSAVDEVQHVRIGQEADLIVIAPASADLLARAAQGRADDLLSATLLVATCPVVFAPAMHTEMWYHPATQENIAALRQHGAVVLEPAHGRLTGKDSGPGRLPDPDQIAKLALTVVKQKHALTRDLEGLKVLISAGGTKEAIDPVRFIGNHSSGRQGFALAEIAAHRGAQVTIVAGSTDPLPTPSGASVIRVSSAREMASVMEQESAETDICICAAAVADFRPETTATEKMKKGHSDEALRHIELVENPDILASIVRRREVGEVPQECTIVGFAAETGDAAHTPLEHATAKIERKGCDLLMCNDVSGGQTFGSEDNVGWILDGNGGVTHVSRGTKHDIAAVILNAVVRQRQAFLD